MNCNRFYVLKAKPTGKDERARTDAVHEDDFRTSDDGLKCPACGYLVGMRTWLPPFRVEIESWGKEFGDLAFGVHPSILVSERFKHVYVKGKLTGLSGFDPVEIVKVTRFRKLRGEPPCYFKVNVVRARAAVDFAASRFEWTTEPGICPECLSPTREGASLVRWKGVVIRPETWEGEDIFIPRGFEEFIVSSRFKELCEENHIKNAVFVPAETYEGDFWPSESKILLKNLKVFEDPEYDREARQDAYDTLAFTLYRDRSRSRTGDFDPDADIDQTVIDETRKRLTAEGLYGPT